MARPQPHIIREHNGSERIINQAQFNELLSSGLILKVRKKYAVIRDGYYCFEDQETGRLRFMSVAALSASNEKGTAWKDEGKYQPPFPAYIDLDYLMRTGQDRNESLRFLEEQESQGYQPTMYKAANHVLNLR